MKRSRAPASLHHFPVAFHFPCHFQFPIPHFPFPISHFQYFAENDTPTTGRHNPSIGCKEPIIRHAYNFRASILNRYNPLLATDCSENCRSFRQENELLRPSFRQRKQNTERNTLSYQQGPASHHHHIWWSGILYIKEWRSRNADCAALGFARIWSSVAYAGPTPGTCASPAPGDPHSAPQPPHTHHRTMPCLSDMQCMHNRQTLTPTNQV